MALIYACLRTSPKTSILFGIIAIFAAERFLDAAFPCEILVSFFVSDFGFVFLLGAQAVFVTGGTIASKARCLCGNTDAIEQSKKKMHLRTEADESKDDTAAGLDDLGRDVDKLLYKSSEFHS